VNGWLCGPTRWISIRRGVGMVGYRKFGVGRYPGALPAAAAQGVGRYAPAHGQWARRPPISTDGSCRAAAALRTEGRTVCVRGVGEASSYCPAPSWCGRDTAVLRGQLQRSHKPDERRRVWCGCSCSQVLSNSCRIHAAAVCLLPTSLLICGINDIVFTDHPMAFFGKMYMYTSVCGVAA